MNSFRSPSTAAPRAAELLKLPRILVDTDRHGHRSGGEPTALLAPLRYAPTVHDARCDFRVIVAAVKLTSVSRDPNGVEMVPIVL